MLAFVYADTPNNNHPGTFFVACAGGCADAANWTETTLTEAFAFDKPSIAFTPGGQPRIAHGLSLDDGLYLAYAACDAGCADPANWQVTLLTKMHGSATYSLQSDAQGRPRLAFLSGSYAAAPFTDHQLYYLWCDAGCAADAANWQFANVGVYMAAGNVDLALDAQGRPRLAFMMAEGLGYGWCNGQCESDAGVWQTGVVESNDSLAENFEVLPIHKCTVSKWINGNRAWLVMDKDGNPRLAYDAQHIWSGVYVDDPGRNCYIEDVTMARAAFFDQP
jgi:hypothetical protein